MTGAGLALVLLAACSTLATQPVAEALQEPSPKTVAIPRATPRATPVWLTTVPAMPARLAIDPTLSELELRACLAANQLNIDIGLMDLLLIELNVVQWSGGKANEVRRVGRQVQSRGSDVAQTVRIVQQSGLAVPKLNAVKAYGKAVARAGGIAKRTTDPRSRTFARALQAIARKEKPMKDALRRLEIALDRLDCGWPL